MHRYAGAMTAMEGAASPARGDGRLEGGQGRAEVAQQLEDRREALSVERRAPEVAQRRGLEAVVGHQHAVLAVDDLAHEALQLRAAQRPAHHVVGRRGRDEDRVVEVLHAELDLALERQRLAHLVEPALAAEPNRRHRGRRDANADGLRVSPPLAHDERRGLPSSSKSASAARQRLVVGRCATRRAPAGAAARARPHRAQRKRREEEPHAPNVAVSAPAVGRIAERAQEQRHVVVRRRVAHDEHDGASG